MKITNYELKITDFRLPVQKLVVPLLPNSTYNPWAKNQSNYLQQDKGSALYGGQNERTDCISPGVCGVHTYGGRCCFIAILIIMNSIKNYFEWLLCSEDGLTDWQFLILLQEGGES